MPRRVLVTGCTSGIGRACATVFAAGGFDVIATAREVDTLDGLDVTQRVQLDVCDPASVASAVATAGPVDVLVNNAGISVWGPLEEVPLELVSLIFETNVLGALRVFKEVMPGMRARGEGAVVNVGSLAAHSSGAMLGLYSATKAALSRLGEAMRAEVGPQGIRVSTIELAGVNSDFPKNRIVPEVKDLTYARMLQSMTDGIVAKRGNSISSELAAEWIFGIVEEEEPASRYVVGLDQSITRVE